MYVLQRTDGAYVALPGSKSSYTKYLQAARTFYTKEAAERDRCPGNERVVALEDAMGSRTTTSKSLETRSCPPKLGRRK